MHMLWKFLDVDVDSQLQASSSNLFWLLDVVQATYFWKEL